MRTFKVVFETTFAIWNKFFKALLLDDMNIWNFCFEYNYIVDLLLFWFNLVYMGNQLNQKPKIKFTIQFFFQLGWL
jgi:hypothetical protein